MTTKENTKKFNEEPGKTITLGDILRTFQTSSHSTASDPREAGAQILVLHLIHTILRKD
jgi:hypothetical protein